jgi:geranylgeranyl diphosphate synthase type II
MHVSLNIIEKYVPLIEKHIQQIPLGETPASLYDPCRYILGNGGKRIRPVLTLLGAGLCGGSVERAIPAALSVELIHNFTLVHDDIMDEADSRRGKPSIHKKWNKPAAILAGDLLYAEAFRQLLTYAEDGSITKSDFSNLIETLLHSIQTVCEGQAMDMEFETIDDVTTDQYLTMIEGKTSALISGALVMGAIVEAASRKQVVSLKELGKELGMAFQIQDDLLDVIADPEKFGKTKAGDIREGKKTYLLLLAQERCNEIQRNELHRLIASKQMSDSDVDRVIAIFEETDAIRLTQQKVNKYYQNVSVLLEPFDDSVYKEDLVSLMNFLKNRDF